MSMNLQVRQGELQGGVCPVPEAAITLIGRAPWSDIVLDHPDVSPTHCLLAPTRDGPGFRLFDARSRHGTWVNGAPFSKGMVHPGDVIAVGPFEIDLLAAQDTATESAAPGRAADAPGPFELVHLHERGASYPLPPGCATVVGSGPLAHVRLDDPFVSEYHFVVDLDPEDTERTPFVLDLHSSNGTLVNGGHIHRRHVQPCDILTVGRMELQVRPTGAEGRQAAASPRETAEMTTEIIFGPDPGRMITPSPQAGRGDPEAEARPSGASEGQAVPQSFNYEAFYGFRDRPFQLSADPDFFFRSRRHWGAYTMVLRWLRTGPPIAVVMGDSGCGKTLLVACLARRLSYCRPFPVVVRPGMECPTLASLVEAALRRAVELYGALPTKSRGPLGRWRTAVAELRRRNVVVVFLLDDAAAPGRDYLGKLADLVETQPALEATRILLTGDARLGELIDAPPLLPYVGAACRLTPLGLEEVAAYVTHRIRTASGRPDLMLSRRALDLIATYSRGVPRLINIVTDAALFAAFRANQYKVTREIVAGAIRDALASDLPPKTPDAAR